MAITPYSSFFSLIVFFLFLLPAIFLGIKEKSIKSYGMIISIPMLMLVMGISLKLLEFLIFLIYQLIIIFVFLQIKNKSTKIFITLLTLSIIPLFVIKCGDYVPKFLGGYNLIGFIGASYVSFRVWQMMFEIRDGHVESLSIANCLYFITFFPTISSGPIDRFDRFMKDINSCVDRETYIKEYLIPGLIKIGRGILYKFAIATAINLFIIDKLSSANKVLFGFEYMYFYTFYLFFDFAGYSNFAVGTSYILAVKSPDNFNKPFLARNMKEFWERWHISLSKWFGDFVFSRFVLSVIRSGKVKNKKVAVRLGYMLTMTIMGIWHGFYVHYVLYGIYEGLLLVLTDIYLKSKLYRKFKKSKYYVPISIFICFNLVSFGMLIFSGRWISY